MRRWTVATLAGALALSATIAGVFSTEQKSQALATPGPVLIPALAPAGATGAGLSTVGILAPAVGVSLVGLGTGLAIGWAGENAVRYTLDELNRPSTVAGASVTSGIDHGWRITANLSGPIVAGSPGWNEDYGFHANVYLTQGDYELGTNTCNYQDGTVTHDSSYGNRNYIGSTQEYQKSCRAVLDANNDGIWSPLTGGVSESVGFNVQDIQAVPTRWRAEYDCQRKDGSIFTVANTSWWITADTGLPTFDCGWYGDNAHLVGVRIIGYSNGVDLVNLLTWSAFGRFTNPHDIYAQCMALAGRSPCTVTATVPGVGAVDWADVDPATGVWTDPDTGDTRVPGPCQWGPYTVPATECYPDAPDDEPEPNPSPTATASPTPTPSETEDVCDVPATWTWAAENHIDRRHIEGGDLVDEYAGIWGVPDQDGNRPYVETSELQGLMTASNSVKGRLQANGRCIRTKSAGSPIGTQPQVQGGFMTSEYSVIYLQDGDLYTMHPGIS